MSRDMRNALLLGLVLALVGVGGCQQYAKITWDPPEPPEGKPQVKTPLAVGELAAWNRKGGVWDKDPGDSVIGKHTLTIFAIPVGSLSADKTTPVQPSFRQAVRDGLEAAGYELVPAAEAPPGSPVLRGEIRACWWWSYTWLWPCVVQGGENKVNLILEDAAGKELWREEISRIEPGVAAGGSYGFDLMIKWSMTKLVQDIVDKCSSEEFAALATKGAVHAAKAAKPGPETVSP